MPCPFGNLPEQNSAFLRNPFFSADSAKLKSTRIGKIRGFFCYKFVFRIIFQHFPKKVDLSKFFFGVVKFGCHLPVETLCGKLLRESPILSTFSEFEKKIAPFCSINFGGVVKTAFYESIGMKFKQFFSEKCCWHLFRTLSIRFQACCLEFFGLAVRTSMYVPDDRFWGRVVF